MPRLTLPASLAALASVVLLAMTIPQASAGTGGAIQDFTVDSAICYGSAPVATLVCPGGSDIAAPASSGATMHTVSHVQQGSRLGAPIVYTPGAFGFTAGTVGVAIGEVTAQLDLLCDGNLDVLSGGSDPGDPVGATGQESVTEAWPDSAVWRPFPVIHRGVSPSGADAYVSTLKPTPATFTPLSYDRADLYSLWLGKTNPVFLPSISNGISTALNSVVEEYPATYGAMPGLRVSLSLFLATIDTPTNVFLSCLDSPQDSVQTSTQASTPVTPGLYPRWTTWTSNQDDRGGNISHVVDLACVNVGNFGGTDADGDCLPAGPDPDDNAADADGDLLVDGIEAQFGTSRTNGDTDGDGATDYTEMLGFTNPNATDTDGDGSLDKPDTGADEVPGGAVNDTTADDNCPAIANAPQTNSDYADDYNGTTGDPTNPSQDPYGDACDTDDDNDRVADAAEATMHILLPLGNELGFCKKDNADGAVLQPTDTLDPDTDDDLGLDGAECKFDSNPRDFGSKMAGQPNDNLGPGGTEGAQETFYRTQKINRPLSNGGGQESNPDADSFADGILDNDSDNDRLLDGAEVKFYGTHPSNDDTDNDGCKDGTEAASVNGDRAVSAIDLSQVAQRFGNNYTPATENALTPPGRVNYDYTKDRNISAVDLGQIASQFGTCPSQGGLTPDDSRQ